MKSGLDQLEVEGRVKEIKQINLFYEIMGEKSFKTIQKKHYYAGYQRGIDEIASRLKKNKNYLIKIKSHPQKGVKDYLEVYFKNRGGNQPDIYIQEDTVFLKTPKEKPCVTIAAEDRVSSVHSDLCHIYCRPFVKGLVQAFEEFIPEMIIHFYSQSSRRKNPNMDCVEVFQVLMN